MQPYKFIYCLAILLLCATCCAHIKTYSFWTLYYCILNIITITILFEHLNIYNSKPLNNMCYLEIQFWIKWQVFMYIIWNWYKTNTNMYLPNFFGHKVHLVGIQYKILLIIISWYIILEEKLSSVQYSKWCEMLCDHNVKALEPCF